MHLAVAFMTARDAMSDTLVCVCVCVCVYVCVCVFVKCLFCPAAHSSLRPITQFAHTVAAETADNGSCRKPYPLPGSDRATASRGEGVRESMSRKSQSLVQLRADASAYANRVRTGGNHT